MPDFILLMHRDTGAAEDGPAWAGYFEMLNRVGAFGGGSAIGAGECLRKSGVPGAASDHLTGFIRVRADSLSEARRLVPGNPVYEAGGTVEVRALPED